MFKVEDSERPPAGGLEPLFTDFENSSHFKSAELQVTFLRTMFDQRVTWSTTLATARTA
jgi:hypothetical protein